MPERVTSFRTTPAPRTRPRRQAAAISVVTLLLVAACAPATSPTTEATVITSFRTLPSSQPSPSTSSPSSTTTSPVEAPAATGSETAQPSTPSGLEFPPVDTGVLSESERLPDEAVENLERGPTAEDGLDFSLTACSVTWFDRIQATATWDAPADTPLPLHLVVGVGLLGGDLAGPTADYSVTLTEPGPFTLVADLDPGEYRSSERPDRFSAWAEPLSAGIQCQLFAITDRPVTSVDTNLVKTELDPVAPLPLHDPGTVQGIAERVDPIDETDPHLAIARLVAAVDTPPLGTVYLLENEPIDSVSVSTASICTAVDTYYRGGAHSLQYAGCPPGSHLTYGSDDMPSSTTRDGWILAGEGLDVSDLIEVPWVGYNGPAPQAFDPTTYADHLDHSDESGEVARFPFRDGLVVVTRYTNGLDTQFGAIDLFTGGGEGIVSGGPGENWNGCYQSLLGEAGYAVIIVADPTWKVETASGRPVPIVATGDVGVGFLDGRFFTPVGIHAVDASGSEPACFSNY